MEFGYFGFEGGDAFFHFLFPVGVGGGRLVDGGFACFGEKVTEGFDAAASSGGNACNEGAVGVVDEGGEDFFDLVEGLEGVEALGALFELASSLGATEEEDGEDGALLIGEVEDVS